MSKKDVQKRCPQSENEGGFQCGHFSDKGREFLQMRKFERIFLIKSEGIVFDIIRIKIML